MPKYVRTVLRQSSDILNAKAIKILEFFGSKQYSTTSTKRLWYEQAFDHREITFVESDIGALVLKGMQHDDDNEYS